MKLTKTQLKQFIKEEVDKLLQEAITHDSADKARDLYKNVFRPSMQEAGVDINQYGEVLRFAARIWEKEVQSAYI